MRPCKELVSTGHSIEYMMYVYDICAATELGIAAARPIDTIYTTNTIMHYILN